jgi:hypothetical protein
MADEPGPPEGLKEALRALALPPGEQLGLRPGHNFPAVALAEEFRHRHRQALSRTWEDLGPELRSSLLEIERLFGAMDGEEEADFWTVYGLRTHAGWAHLRSLAREALEQFKG